MHIQYNNVTYIYYYIYTIKIITKHLYKAVFTTAKSIKYGEYNGLYLHIIILWNYHPLNIKCICQLKCTSNVYTDCEEDIIIYPVIQDVLFNYHEIVGLGFAKIFAIISISSNGVVVVSLKQIISGRNTMSSRACTENI